MRGGQTDSTITVCLRSSALGIITMNKYREHQENLQLFCLNPSLHVLTLQFTLYSVCFSMCFHVMSSLWIGNMYILVGAYQVDKALRGSS